MPKSPYTLYTLTALIMSLSSPLQALEITTSIKPLQLLVASISEGVSRPTLLIPGANSPHDYQLRPSERRQLEQAGLIFWIGPKLEMSLAKVLQQLPSSTRVVALAEQSEESASQLPLHAQLQAQLQAPSQEHNHEYSGGEPHIWLDPVHAAELARKIATILSEENPAHSADYQKNLGHFLAQLNHYDLKLKALLDPVKNLGYFVFHDAYQGFEQHYGLNHLGAFTLSPERRPGARHLAEIRQQLLNHQAVCVFSEPQFPPSLVSNLIEGTHVRQAQLDPLGIAIEADANGYYRLLMELGLSFQRCLEDN